MNTPAAYDLRELALAETTARIAILDSSPAGLTAIQVAERQVVYGRNEPLHERDRHLLLRFSGNFTHTLALLLWFAAGLAFAASIPELGFAIVGVVVVNGLFAFVEEYRAEKLVTALMREVAVKTAVRRDGIEHIVPASELVPGDVVRLRRGDVVPADCVLIASENLSLDLSVVTGESAPVERSAEPFDGGPDSLVRLHELRCVAPASAVVVTGAAEALIVATGARSTVGQIASMVETLGDTPSVLQRQVAALSRFTAVAAVLAGTLTLILASVSADVGFLAALTFSTGVIVALVPEGLLPTLSVSLAIGGQRMAQRGAAIRRLSAVESVGSVTVICTDKTGTLTQNTLTVAGVIQTEQTADGTQAILDAAAYCNEAYQDVAGTWVGDSIDVALAEWASAEHLNVNACRAHVRTRPGMPFDAMRRLMTVLCTSEGEEFEVAKGAPEAVVELAGGHVPDSLLEEIHRAAGQGERVVMLATRRGSDWRVHGALRLADPLRPEVPDAIEACRNAGIRVVMLTGDHPATAQAVARSAGLASAVALTGADVELLTDVELLSSLREQAVFARIDPQQKLRIARVLKDAGEIVVMTGDGINDAPALEAADVGVAMGKRGTEVAKQAADIVLSDDNFATIVAAVEEGRSIKSNIRRFASYVFTSNVAELVPFVLYIFLPIPLPLAVIQVLAIDLGTDLLPALALGAEPASPQAMANAPEPPARPLLTRDLVFKTFAFFGPIEAALGVGAFFAFFVAEGWQPFESFSGFESLSPEARSLTFIGIVAGQIGCVFAQRDGTLGSRLSLTSNPWIGVGLVIEIALAFALIYIPGLNGVFEMERVGLAWLLLLPLGTALFLALDLIRRMIAMSRFAHGDSRHARSLVAQ